MNPRISFWFEFCCLYINSVISVGMECNVISGCELWRSGRILLEIGDFRRVIRVFFIIFSY